MAFTIHHGDCREVMATLDAESVDAIVSDPPYGLSFMGKGWDHGVPGVEFWAEALRVAKPGAHLLAFGGTRTYHRLACAIEDAGWEIRDCVMWVYGSGFPKSHDVSKAIDKAAGAERKVVAIKRAGIGRNARKGGELVAAESFESEKQVAETAPATDAARQWSGWGTALKPAYEPVIVARKPLVGTVAENVLTHGTGAINVDGCRVGTAKGVPASGASKSNNGYQGGWGGNEGRENGTGFDPNLGRWPANLIHDGSEEVVGLFPNVKAGVAVQRNRDGGVHNAIYGAFRKPSCDDVGFADSGSAARFFYCAKASKADRGSDNKHPTVKPTDLMRYLCRLVTPPGGLVLDPFTGSGSTGKAAILEGFRFIGIEREAEYVEIAKARIGAVEAAAGPLFSKCATH
jgi:site-specific DNA-methyltransferase (adenine-specific)